MKMTKEQFIANLINEANNQTIVLSEEQASNLFSYKEMILEWNQKINLTAITEDTQVIIKHFVDSLLLVKYIKDGEKIIDIGSGAGFPGIVLAIYFDGKIEITLLDSLNKRINFLEEVIEKLSIKKINTIHGRAEDIANLSEYREKYDVAVARAVAPLNILLEYMSGYVKKNGKILCMKSQLSKNEIEESKNALEELRITITKNDSYKLVCKNEVISRNIVLANKKEILNSKYPRSFARIKSKPL